MPSPTISLVINAKNEEKHIVDCIKSAQQYVDEIIVADMQSTDKTRELAKKSGAIVFTVKNHGYVEPARNFAIGKATSKWILLLDADERLSATLGTKLKKIAKEDKVDAVWLPRKNIRLDKWMRNGGFWPDYQLRFFKKGKIDWPKEIHHQPRITGRELTLAAKEEYALTHFNITDVRQILEKIDTFTDHETYFKRLGNVTVNQLHHVLQHEFNHRFFHEKGYKDDIHGYIFAKTMEFYRFVEFVKYWDAQGRPEYFSGEEIKEQLNQSERIEKLERQLAEIEDSKIYPIVKLYNSIKKRIKA